MGREPRATKQEAGTVVRRTRWAPAQRVRAHKQWCDADEEVFLDCLAATCNVEMACEQADVAHTTVYRQRRTRADFALKWQAALEQGYAQLEMGLVEAANLALRGELARGPVPVAAMSAETALKVLLAHRASVMGQGKRGGWQAAAMTLEQVQDGILRKIEAIKRARPGLPSPDAPRAGDDGGDDGGTG